MESLADGGQERRQDSRTEEEVFRFETLDENKLKKEVINIVTGFDWQQELDAEKIHDLFETIHAVEGLRRKKRREAMRKRKENAQKLME